MSNLNFRFSFIIICVIENAQISAKREVRELKFRNSFKLTLNGFSFMSELPLFGNRGANKI